MAINFLKRVLYYVCVFTFLFSAGACNGCNGTFFGKNVKSKSEAMPIIKGRLLIDTDFSAPEKKLILEALSMWTGPLEDYMDIEISEDPMFELAENVVLQRSIMMQELAAHPEYLDESGDFSDPHDAWNAFDPRTQFWSVKEGCTDRMVIIRVTSNSPQVKKLDETTNEGEEGPRFIGWTEAKCHAKAIFIIVDRIEDERGFVSTIAHEFGHMFGIRHDFNRNSTIMFPFGNPSSCVTRRDIDSFCARWGCDSKSARKNVKSCER